MEKVELVGKSAVLLKEQITIVDGKVQAIQFP